jgi:hypothetical protein
MNLKSASKIIVVVALSSLAGAGCSTSKADSPCVANAKYSRDMKKESAKKAWENAQYAISDISDKEIRWEQRELSSDRRNKAIESAETKYQAAIASCK